MTKGQGMRLERIILFGIAGIFLAFFFYNFADKGYIERWRKNPSISQEDLDFYFSATNNESDEFPPCDYSAPEFSFLSNAPKNIKQCAVNIIWYPEGYDRTVYIIDSNNNYWVWSHKSILNLYALLWTPIIGFVLGAVIAMVTSQTFQNTDISKKEELGQKIYAQLGKNLPTLDVSITLPIPKSADLIVMMKYVTTFRNVFRCKPDGSIQWQAELPTEKGDVYTNIEWKGDKLIAYSRSCIAVSLDINTGKIQTSNSVT
jgi:hypothetical protein